MTDDVEVKFSAETGDAEASITQLQTARTAAMFGLTTEEVGKLNAVSLMTGTSSDI